MKVLFIAHSSGIQGAGIALESILSGLVNAGLEVVVTLPTKGDLYNLLKEKNYKCYIACCYNSTIPKTKGLKNKVLFIPRWFRIKIINFIGRIMLDRVVQKEKPDIIHTNSGVISIGSVIALKREIPHVWHLREFQTDNNDYPPMGGEKRLKKLFSLTNNTCLTITQGIFNYYQLEPSKDKVLYDGVFHESYFPQIDTKKHSYFLYIGALEEGKGVYDLLEAFEKFAENNQTIELWLAGRDNININKYLSSKSYRNRVKYLGFRSDVYVLMKKALALIVPSFYEGFGFITAEAMINGCLVIGRNTTGTKEQFDNGNKLYGREIGFRFTNTQELIKLLFQVSSMPFLSYYDMALCAQKCAHQYTIEQNINKLIEIYKSIKYEKY